MKLQILAVREWHHRMEAHRSRILPHVEAFRERRKRGLKHPVRDFLFDYYRCKRKLLTEWHPPIGVALAGEAAREFLKDNRFSQNDYGVYLDAARSEAALVSRMAWISRLVESALGRRNQYHCYGLHEWAMLYRPSSIRHEDTPLRLTPAEIEELVESQPIRCSHYDAFRFFTPEARPLNLEQPEREERSRNEQFGCVHFNMDLFKWSYKLSPWISSELMLDCFFLATKAREWDMRASPYDLRAFGYQAIPVETPAGRREYQTGQAEIAEEGRLLAHRLIKECGRLAGTVRHRPAPIEIDD